MLDKEFSHCTSMFFFFHSLVLLFSETVYSFKQELLRILMLYVSAQERSECCKVVSRGLIKKTIGIVVTSHVTMSLNLAHACSVLDFVNL